MTEFENRLADAMANREQQIEVDPEAWQTHLDLVHAHDRSTRGGLGRLGRWRAPALVAASVVAVGLIGGTIAQTGLSGGSPAQPAGRDAGVATASASTASSTPQDVRTSKGGGAPAAPSDGSAIPEPLDRASTAATRQSPRESVTTTRAPQAPVAILTSQRPPKVSGSAGPPPSTTSKVADRTTMGDAAGSGPQAAGLIDLTTLVPCGASLPPLDKEVSGLAIDYGPFGRLTNTAKQPIPVLAVGFAIVSAQGHVATVTGGSAALTKVTAGILAPGATPESDLRSVRPTALCASVPPDRVYEVTQNGPPVFPVATVTGVPAGIYWATSVVVLGDDLAHATAYRAGNIWQLSVGD